jgi:type IV secretion system protein VirB9
MSKKLLSGLITLALAATASGAQLPEAGKKDARIRIATYDPDDVVTVYASVGIETHIVLEPAEKIVDMTGGDTKAWGVASRLARNGVFLKPAGELPNANLHVVTDKRTYTFDLKLARKDKREIPFLTVFFRYPADEQAARAQAQAAAAAAREAEQLRMLLDAAAPAGNRRYSVQGSSALAPIEAWDDGRTTSLRFRARSSIPAIYAARGDRDSLEQIENIHLQDDVVHVQGVRRKLVLRVGEQVACVFNDGFDADAARPETNTASPYVTRSMKGAGK